MCCRSCLFCFVVVQGPEHKLATDPVVLRSAHVVLYNNVPNFNTSEDAIAKSKTERLLSRMLSVFVLCTHNPGLRGSGWSKRIEGSSSEVKGPISEPYFLHDLCISFGAFFAERTPRNAFHTVLCTQESLLSTCASLERICGGESTFSATPLLMLKWTGTPQIQSHPKHPHRWYQGRENH